MLFRWKCLVARCLVIGAVGLSASVPRPPNYWMLTPTPVTAPDTAAASVRAARDQLFDEVSVSRVPLTPENAAEIHVAEGSIYNFDQQPEVPKFPGRVLVSGTFVSAGSVLSHSGRSVYSEAQIQVESVIESGNSHLEAGRKISIASGGGTVRLRDGRIVSFLVSPRAFSIEPGHSYILVLRYFAAGDFFEEAADWDITSGFVVANSREEMRRERLGRAPLVGLPKGEAIQLLRSGHL